MEVTQPILKENKEAVFMKTARLITKTGHKLLGSLLLA
jgi:hypothetical protein